NVSTLGYGFRRCLSPEGTAECVGHVRYQRDLAYKSPYRLRPVFSNLYRKPYRQTLSQMPEIRQKLTTRFATKIPNRSFWDRLHIGIRKSAFPSGLRSSVRTNPT